MPKIRLFNPPRRRRRRGGRRRARGRGGRFIRARSRRHNKPRRRNRNQAPGGGVLTIMANRKKKRRRNKKRRYSRRRRNPVFAANPRRRGRRMKRYRRRRNPAVLGFASISSLAKQAGWAIAGGIVTRSVPQMVLGEQNTGAFGYLGNGVTAVAASMLAERFAGKEAGQAVLIGGAVMLSGRLVEDFIGKKLVEFTGIPSLLGADYKYDLSGEYVAQSFPVPFNYQKPLPAAALPAVSGMAGPWRKGAWRNSPWAN